MDWQATLPQHPMAYPHVDGTTAPALPGLDGVLVRDLLLSLGFTEDWNLAGAEPTDCSFDFGNLVLEAVVCINRSFRQVFKFGGTWCTDRELGIVEFEMPLSVASREEGIAWIAHGVTKDFVPNRSTPWLEEGRALTEHLPWVREARRYDARPRCVVARDWMRFATKKLRAASVNAGPEEICRVSFDGTVLLFVVPIEPVAVPAVEGVAWAGPAEVRVTDLEGLPLRFQGEFIEVCLWENALRIGSRAFRMIHFDDKTQ